jgi:hypothetical protein
LSEGRYCYCSAPLSKCWMHSLAEACCRAGGREVLLRRREAESSTPGAGGTTRIQVKVQVIAGGRHDGRAGARADGMREVSAEWGAAMRG